MKKKAISSIALSIAAAAGAFGFAGCGNNGGDPQHYNIIFTNSSNPPTLSALLAIKSDDPTYAYVQRGNTYYGIEDTKNFTNIGFNIDKQTNPVTQAEVSKVSDAVKQIARKKKNSTFTIYVTDYNAYGAFAAAYQAGLDDDDFNVVMVEDGSGSYSAANFTSKYITNKTLEESNTYFESVVQSAKDNIAILKKNPNALGSTVAMQDYQAWAGLATLKNASFHTVAIQTYKTQFETAGLTDTLFYKSINNESSTGYNLKMTEGTSAVLYEGLTDAQKSEYLKLIGGDRVVATLRRTQDIKGNPVSSKKFVIVGSRAKSNTMSMMPDIASADELIAYDDIATSGSDALKEVVSIVFTNKDDYNQVLTILNDEKSAFTDAQKIAAFNLFAENKFMFQIIANYYGNDRDLIFKGHPSEVVTDKAQWQTSHYPCGTDGNFVDAIYNLVDNFFKNDSLGSRIGVAIGGCDMSNYAFFGDLDYSIGGMSSSTYASYNKKTPVDLIMSAGASTSYNGAAARYLEGTLKDTDGDVTTYLNTGSMYQLLGKEEKLQAWLVSTFGVATENAKNYGVNKQGFVAKRSVEDGVTTITNISRNVTVNYADGTTANVTKAYANGDVLQLETPTRAGYTFMGWYNGEAKQPSVVVFNTIQETEMTITAKWAKNYDVTFKASKDGDVITTKTVPEGADLAELSKDIKNPAAVEGKTYRLVWHNVVGDAVVTTMPSSDVTLYAEWVETVTVKYSLKKGGAEVSLVVDANKTWQDVVEAINAIKGIKNPDGDETEVTGLKFAENDSAVALEDPVDPTKTVYAVWTIAE